MELASSAASHQANATSGYSFSHFLVVNLRETLTEAVSVRNQRVSNATLSGSERSRGGSSIRLGARLSATCQTPGLNFLVGGELTLLEGTERSRLKMAEISGLPGSDIVVVVGCCCVCCRLHPLNTRVTFTCGKTPRLKSQCDTSVAKQHVPPLIGGERPVVVLWSPGILGNVVHLDAQLTKQMGNKYFRSIIYCCKSI